jgi:hypothetical protein
LPTWIAREAFGRRHLLKPLLRLPKMSVQRRKGFHHASVYICCTREKCLMDFQLAIKFSLKQEANNGRAQT